MPVASGWRVPQVGKPGDERSPIHSGTGRLTGEAKRGRQRTDAASDAAHGLELSVVAVLAWRFPHPHERHHLGSGFVSRGHRR
jgi:hypothetical protein